MIKNMNKKPKLLLLTDSLTSCSGVGIIGKNIAINLVHKWDIAQIAAAINHPDKGKIIDMSESFKTQFNCPDAYVKLYPSDGYGNPQLLREVIDLEKPDILLIITDPRYWIWLYEMENEIRQTIPIAYYHVWDNLPVPEYNQAYYDSCDSIMCISKLTKFVVENSSKKLKDITYIPHGVSETEFYPIDDKELKYRSQKFIGNTKYDFIMLYNNRNIFRKNVPDVMESFKLFVEKLTPEQASKCLLILKTDPMDNNGTDLFAVANMLQKTCKNKINFLFIGNKLDVSDLNTLYNLADVTINIAGQEGWGLSSTESIMAGTPVINNITGGLQDQCNFTTLDGKPIELITNINSDFTYDIIQDGIVKYKQNLKHGEWCFPIYPATRSIIGSIKTPYLYDDKVNNKDVMDTIFDMYCNTNRSQRKQLGMVGRNWAINNKLTAKDMAISIGENMLNTLNNFKGKDKYSVYKF